MPALSVLSLAYQIKIFPVLILQGIRSRPKNPLGPIHIEGSGKIWGTKVTIKGKNGVK